MEKQKPVRILHATEGKVSPYILQSKVEKILKRRNQLERVHDVILSFSEGQLQWLISLPEDQIFKSIIEGRVPQKGKVG